MVDKFHSERKREADQSTDALHKQEGGSAKKLRPDSQAPETDKIVNRILKEASKQEESLSANRRGKT